MHHHHNPLEHTLLTTCQDFKKWFVFQSVKACIVICDDTVFRIEEIFESIT
jgi:hypothetical protein